MGHRGDQPDQQVSRARADRARAVLPRVLEWELELAVGEPLEPVLGDRRAGDVATETLELSAVPPGGAGAGGVTGA